MISAQQTLEYHNCNSWMMNFVILRYLVLHHNRLFVVYSCFDCFFSKFYFV
ncbi:hypothetical protein Hanom_Chr10g00883641 [Helianthus anomalus]